MTKLTKAEKAEIKRDLTEYAWSGQLRAKPTFMTKIRVNREIVHRFRETVRLRRMEAVCAKRGHKWEEINCDGENGISELCCKRCGERDVISFCG